MLFEVIGLGCGFGPLNNRFFPPMGSILYWLRPKTIRLPPWPNRIPTDQRRRRRRPWTWRLYGALLVMLTVALFSQGTGPIPERGTEVGVLPVWQTAAILGLLALAGPARQGDLPRRPRRGVRVAGGVLPLQQAPTSSSRRSWSAW